MRECGLALHFVSVPGYTLSHEEILHQRRDIFPRHDDPVVAALTPLPDRVEAAPERTHADQASDLTGQAVWS